MARVHAQPCNYSNLFDSHKTDKACNVTITLAILTIKGLSKRKIRIRKQERLPQNPAG